MKPYILARLAAADRAALERLKKATGQSESAIVRRGLRLVEQEEQGRQSALDLAGRSVGRFKSGPRDLSTSGTVRVKAPGDVRALKGLLRRSRRRQVTLRLMNQVIARRGQRQ